MKYLLILSLVFATGVFAAVPETGSDEGSAVVKPYTPTKDLLFDQTLVTHSATQSSEYIAAFNLDSRAADDFELAASVGGWRLESVTWWGGWWNPGYSAPPDAINVFLYDDAGNIPTNPVEGGEFWSYSTSTFTETNVGTNLFTYEFDIDAGSQPELDGETLYWIAVQLEHTFPPQAGCGYTTGTTWGNPACWGSSFFGQPNWVVQGWSTNFVLYGSEIDATAPFASGQDPADGATGVATDADIVFHVEDDLSGVDTSTITTSSVVVTDDTKANITGSISIDDSDPLDVIVTFDPDNDFVNNSTVTVTVSPAGNKITDNEGNEMAEDSWSFTVIPAGVESSSLGAIKAGFK